MPESQDTMNLSPSSMDTPLMSMDSGPVMLNEQVEVYPDRPLPAFDYGPIKAYEGRGTGTVPDKVIVYPCEIEYSPRTNTIQNYIKIINPNLARLVATGVVYWPPLKKHRYVLVYENNLGSRIVNDDVKAGYEWDQDNLMGAVIKPMVSVLKDFRDKEIIHGCIRPANMFNGGSKNMDRLILGDCLSMPAFANLPSLYLPIDKALAHPLARGKGTHEDDLYAFGVSLAVLLRDTDPLAGMSDEQIVALKHEKGSYLTLTGKDRFTGAVLELLRGLLFDDPAQRWTIDEVQAWLDGRRLSPKQTAKKNKASRPLILEGRKHLYPEILAIDMPKFVTEAAHMIEQDDLGQWLKRAVEDKPLTERVEKAMQIANEQGRGAGYQERLVTRVCIALNPGGPIQFRGLKILPEGFGTLLTNAIAKKMDLQPYADFITQYFVMQWLDMSPSMSVDAGALTSKFDTCRAFLRQTTVGFGVERILYFLDPCAPCLSEKLADYYVRNPEDLLYAYEHMAGTNKQPHYFLDRHIVAFLSIKDRKNIDPYISDVSSADAYKRILGEIRVLATIQTRSRMDPFPKLTHWVADNLDPVYERFHDRELRKTVKAKVEKLRNKGDIAKIAAIFDNIDLYKTDTGMFFKAIHEYVRLTNEKRNIKTKMMNKATYGQEAGRQAAAVLSCILAAIVILASAFMAFGDKLTGL